MDATANFERTLAAHEVGPLVRGPATTLQVNVGKRCNQACHHCHVEAGPQRREMMTDEVAKRVLTLLASSPGVELLDLTGGAPELNPNFRWLIREARRLGRRVIDRCNLTVLLEPGMEDLPEFLAEHLVEVVASLPCYGPENVDRQRGHGAFDKSIAALRRLNALGYGTEQRLDLVYNPVGAFLPPPQAELETRYREELRGRFGLEFHRPPLLRLHCGRRVELRGSPPVSLGVVRTKRGLARLAPILLSARLASAACTPVDHDHAAWTAILGRFVRGGEVAYGRLAREGAPMLASYLDGLSSACADDYARWGRAERLAFWINAYNAFTVRLVLDHYPIASIRKIGWLPGAAFRERFVPMPGLKGGIVSLDDIENGTLRADFREPRIHFALVCASRSCPMLRSEAYRAGDLDRQLDDQARTFLADSTKNRFDSATNTLHLSSIFKWFRADFEAAAGSLPAYVGRYLSDPRATAPDVRIEFLDYDWSLNDQAPQGEAR